MFDDQTKTNQSGTTGGQDLNKGKEFPFRPVGSSERKLAGNKAPVEDIMAETDTSQPTATPISEPQKKQASSQPELKPAPQVPSMTSSAPKNKFKPVLDNVTSPGSLVDSTPHKSSNVFVIIITILIAVFFILAGLYAYQYLTNRNTQEEAPVSDGSLEKFIESVNSGETQPIEQFPDENNNEILPEENLAPQIKLDELGNILNELDDSNENLDDDDIVDQEKENLENINQDSDNDGLTDIEEIELGTNPDEFDSDDDGLSDFEEIQIYKTDPFSQDTDEDGYTDGQEVRNGYHPLIPGGEKL